MKQLTNNQLGKLIVKSWPTLTGDFLLSHQFLAVLGGELEMEHHHIIPNSHEVWLIIIKDPKYQITSGQLCQIIDEGNHCISRGSIVYEENYAYITWSNLGHI